MCILAQVVAYCPPRLIVSYSSRGGRAWSASSQPQKNDGYFNTASIDYMRHIASEQPRSLHAFKART